MFATDKKSLTLVYAVCGIQFILVFLVIHFTCQPITKGHVLIVGLSAILGLIFSGHERRTVYSGIIQKKTDQRYQALDQEYKKIQDDTRNSE